MRAAAIVVALASASTAWGAFGGFGVANPIDLAGFGATDGMAAGDLNADGRIDLVHAGRASGGAQRSRVLLNQGGGIFASTDYSESGGGQIRLADIDGDGDLDLLRPYSDSFAIRGVWRRLNDGAGTFGSAAALSTSPQQVNCLAAGDVDGDGDEDVLYGAASTLYLVRNGVTTSLASSGIVREIICEDLDGDGDRDVAYTNASDDTVRILVNNGPVVGFTPGDVEVTVGEPAPIETGDFDRDGDLDLVVRTRNPTPTIAVFVNDGAAGFTAGFSIATADNQYIAVADIDGDLDPDLVANDGSNVRIFPCDGTGGFAAPLSTPATNSSQQLLLADLDGNASPDLVVGYNFGTLPLNWYANLTDVLPPQVPTLLSPADNAEGLPLPEQWGWSGVGARLTWSQATGFQPVTFTVTIATDAGFVNTILSQGGVSTNSFPVPAGLLAQGDRYFWKVDAANSIGSVTSATSTFSTRCDADANRDASVDAADLSVLLSQFGGPCPK